MAAKVFQLKCGCKNDPWGKTGKDSLAGVLCSKTPGALEWDDSKTYSEMWMGTYPTVPSRILATDELLSEYLQKHPEVVGQSVLEKWGPEVPFLPKILSFSKALPLQIHPDKALAEKLHQTDPNKYSDPNHKPEIAIALSNFELFAGFKPLSDISTLMRIAPLQRFLPPDHPQTFTDSHLRDLTRTLLSLPASLISTTVNELLSIPESNFGPTQRYIPGLLDRLRKQYPDTDPGSLVAVLLMNYMTLGPGEAVCVPADSVHAYLCGDILECMARSDNVLNTGFCAPAERDDVGLFTEALTFKPHAVDEGVLGRRKSVVGGIGEGRTEVYQPPFGEFGVLGVSLGAGERERHGRLEGLSLVVVVKGKGWMEVTGGEGEGEKWEIGEGAVFFVGAGVDLEFGTEKGLLVYRPYAE
ncbi:mannose-6-phosphate isomerase, class I [Aspergillus ibericus CBS 121593]|uniref:Mannose-6-phosphate isomerase n=1 Tax=Aspergillus ibericus CBS 121593 TaxID=1448316 RepID=A0A395HG53_9EURO|nr:mannose-6-phosphate isomerase, class I [Aspergillus ibericus CBS 121593]RAL05968.1 mannose-6-phosphate isomerase, class I [Aspergillus ibericus CBS 121593]